MKCFSSLPLVRKFFIHSKLNIFLSPLHRTTSLKILGLDQAPPSFVLKPTIDTKHFFNKKIERDIDYLFMGVIGEAKGLDEMREKYRKVDIHLAGKLYPGAKLDFGTYHGSVPYGEVPNLMNRAKNFVFLPRWPEPQGRVVIEAALCGCNLITNDHVGGTSFDFDITDPKNFENAASELWQAVESVT
jgi:glycosyltransferase involved in cell wall biosynthesis